MGGGCSWRLAGAFLVGHRHNQPTVTRNYRANSAVYSYDTSGNTSNLTTRLYDGKYAIYSSSWELWGK